MFHVIDLLHCMYGSLALTFGGVNIDQGGVESVRLSAVLWTTALVLLNQSSILNSLKCQTAI